MTDITNSKCTSFTVEYRFANLYVGELKLCSEIKEFNNSFISTDILYGVIYGVYNEPQLPTPVYSVPKFSATSWLTARWRRGAAAASLNPTPLPSPSSEFSASDTSLHLASPPSSPHLFLLPPCLHISSLSSYWAATAWVSPPEVRSWIRLPEAGRSTPVAQLKNILESNKTLKSMIMLIVRTQRRMSLPPGLVLFLYPHLFHLGLSKRIKSHSNSP